MKSAINVALLLFIPISTIAPKDAIQQYNREVVNAEIGTKEHRELTIESLAVEVVRQDFREPEAVFKQILLESGYLKSWLAQNNNNLIGMKLPRQRETYAIGEQKGFAVYKTWQDCIRDLKLYQDLYMKDGETYFQFLKRRGYAEDPNYFNKIESIKVKQIERLKR